MEFIEKLRIKFEAKLKNEWEEKWSSFGTYDSDKNNRRSKFYTALAQSISKRSTYPISRDTISRFDKGEGGDSLPSLDAYARYLDFKSFDDFELKNSPKSKKTDWLNKAFLIPSLLVLFSVTTYYFFIKPYLSKAEITELVQKANKTQFDAYVNLPKIDSLKLSNYYEPSKSAYKSAISVLTNNLKANRRICLPVNNPSYYKVFSIEVISLKNNKAIVQTDEHWFLKWYDLIQGKYTVSYDVRNKQIYEVEQKDAQWKITHNYFEGQARPITY
ncbi:hypothetical protein [Arcticibacterium luteifluviistationis]|uniref:Uncharacterized protein n=1 Tax=Arcticibacterium luteifluviistationis TaxID=1784714 RepID=A0A2Z4GCK5_9BACT|nr:hypothetical protein [Arcticibacterium luteifluviistationis]AWV99029.1 hypothetical protein DJ013_12980 [Arcticibacterium luteifluviistationis]